MFKKKKSKVSFRKAASVFKSGSFCSPVLVLSCLRVVYHRAWKLRNRVGEFVSWELLSGIFSTV